VLSIIFFILYINGLIKITIEEEIICYITVILLQNKNIEHLNTKENTIFNSIKSWFDNNLLGLNIDKTKYIIFN